jgi:DeoR/GlpR family transcriptional regulator of sugar metabolism
MLAELRQARILDEIRDTGFIKVRDLMQALSVSDATVRRDLKALATRGLVLRIHGGANLIAGLGPTPEAHRQRAAKQAIAQRAALLVCPGSAIGVGAGTTAAAFARAISSVPDITVVTNSLSAARALALGSPVGRGPAVILIGGMCTANRSLAGPIAVRSIKRLHLDCHFTGAHGIGLAAGLTVSDLVEAETSRALIDAADRTVVLADHTKWAVTALCPLARLDEVDTLVSDSELPVTAQRLLAARVGNLVLAEPAGITPHHAGASR